MDLRPLIRRLYPRDEVTELLLSRPLPLNRRRWKLLWLLFRSTFYDERLRFCGPFMPKRPHGVAIEITNACNLRCQMCNWTEMSRPAQRMKFDLYRTIIRRCVDAGIVNVRLHTYGETLLHPDLAAMIEHATESGLKVWISTNGQLLHERIGRRILMAGVSEVRYSIDGATAATYEQVRQGASWTRLLANMRTFRQLRDEISLSTALGLNMVVMRETIGEISQLWDVFGDLVDSIHVSPLEALGTHGRRLAAGRMVEALDWSRRIPCRLPWDMMNITVDGKATLCCADIDAAVEVGDAATQDLLPIWRGRSLERIRAHHRQRQFDRVDICAQCSFGVTNTALNRFRYALLDDRGSYGRRVR